MKKLLIVMLLCTALPALAQNTRIWRGLALDNATIEDAVSALGQPSEVKENQKLKTAVGFLINKHARYTTLEFKKVSGAKHAKLYFQENTLKAVSFKLKKKVKPGSLRGTYGLYFVSRRVPEVSLFGESATKWTLTAQTKWSYVVAYTQRSVLWPGKVVKIHLISKSLKNDEEER